ncbi:MAG: hypothetical protein HKN29_06545 [Rhodothermales bacterium]|nr:hypothetical protein [Rhodothermales bacterium]
MDNSTRHRRPGVQTVCGLLLLLFAWLPPAAQAQVGEQYTLAWRGTDLDQALREFQAASGINIVWLPLLAEGKKVYCVARSEPAEEVLKCILSGTGLDFYRRSSGTYVIEPSVEAPPLWGNMRGIVVDAGTGQPVPSAHVFLAEAQRGRVANTSGMFAFDRLLPGDYAVQVSHIGYRTTSLSIEIEPGGSVRPEIRIVAQPVLLAPLVLEGLAMRPSSTLLGFAMMDQEDLTGSLGPGGSALQGLDGLMGVRVNDATADIHIQGGDAGEHQFRLDGAPVFIPLNVASFIGPFSPFALGSIRIHKAGFGAPLGSHISGVIEARHDLRYGGARSGPDGLDGAFGYQSRTLVQGDPLSVNLRHSGSFERTDGTRGSLMAASRVGIWRLSAPSSLVGLLDDWNRIDSFLLSAFADRNTPFSEYPPLGSPEIGFADLHLAGEVKRGLSTLNASLFTGGSRLGNDLGGVSAADPESAVDDIAQFTDIYEWRSTTAQARYNTVLTGRTLGSIQARYSRYGLSHDFVARDLVTLASPEDDGNQMSEAAISAKLDYALADRHYTEFGLELIRTADRVRIAGSQQLPLDHSFTGWRTAVFAQDKIQVGQHAVVELGSRFTFLNARASLYAEPRLAVRLDFPGTRTGDWSFFAGSGIYRQFVNQFDVSSRSPRTFVSSTRFWMAVDSTVAPPKSGHLTGELFWRPTARWSLSAEAHYKRHYHILSIDYSANTDVPALDQDDFLRSSKGHTYGYAAVLKRSLGLGSADLRYEYTVGRRQIAGLFEGRLLDVPWNEPHRLELSANVMPMNRLVLLGRWRLISGRTWGFRQAYYDFMGAYLNDIDRVLDSVIDPGARARVQRQADYYELTNPEEHRLPDLIQMDVGAGYSFEVGSIGMQARLDVINILGRTNTADWRFFQGDGYFDDQSPTGSGILERGRRELLPRVVTFALRFSW